MKKQIIITLCALFALVGCSIDNFDGPNCRFHGALYDSISYGTPNPQVVPASVSGRLEFIELGFDNFNPSKKYMDFNVNGEYINNNMFSGYYDFALEATGAYYKIEPLKSVWVPKGDFEFNIYVTPYLRVSDEAITLDEVSGTIKAKFDISSGKVDPKVTAKRYAMFVYSDRSVSAYNTLTSTTPANINNSANVTLPGSVEFTIPYKGAGSLNLASGKTYYIRCGAVSSVDNNDKRYNYGTQIVKIDIP